MPPRCWWNYILFKDYSFTTAAAAAARSLQSCPTLCDPIDGSPPGSPVPGILQARTLEWVAISFSNAWKWKVKVKSLSRVRPSANLWTAAHQASPSMGFSRQECWSGAPLSSPLAPRKTLSVEGAGGKLKEEGLLFLFWYIGFFCCSCCSSSIDITVLGGGTYTRLSGSVGSTSTDSTNCRSKTLKNQQYTGNYLHIIYMVFTSICTAFTLNCK